MDEKTITVSDASMLAPGDVIEFYGALDIPKWITRLPWRFGIRLFAYRIVSKFIKPKKHVFKITKIV